MVLPFHSNEVAAFVIIKCMQYAVIITMLCILHEFTFNPVWKYKFSRFFLFSQSRCLNSLPMPAEKKNVSFKWIKCYSFDHCFIAILIAFRIEPSGEIWLNANFIRKNENFTTVFGARNVQLVNCWYRICKQKGKKKPYKMKWFVFTRQIMLKTQIIVDTRWYR